jgi:N-acetylmuramoyl-L-alanine amidase
VQNILEDLDRSARVRQSRDLAKVLHEEWKRPEFSARGLPKGSTRTVRQAPFFLVSHVAMPSVLVEVGFLSHRQEGMKLQQTDYQAAIAEALFSGIRRFLDQE